MRLPAYAQKMGVTYQTAYSWFVNNKIPGAYKLPSGTIIIPDEDVAKNERTKTVFMLECHPMNNGKQI